MRAHFLVLMAGLSLSLSAAKAQHQLGPAYYLRHPAIAPNPSLELLPPGPLAAPPATAPIPTVRAAAAYAPRPVPAAAPNLPASPAEPAPRTDLTGSLTYPPYNSYQNLPEAYRKHTLPDVWAEPLPLQLLRSALGR